MASQLRARPRTSNSVALRDTEQPPLPFNGTVRDFMYTARQCQTLIGVGEGQFNHRVMVELKTNVLQRFVGLAIYGDKDRIPNEENHHTGFNREELKCIDSIVDKMVKENKKFDRYRKKGKGEIHYGACYVFGYEYNEPNENRMFKLPLFKVYKDECNSNAIYIDESLNVYNNWEHFLDANHLPLSFICVPKDGLYSIHDDTALQLDFFCMSGIYWTTKRMVTVAIKSTIAVGSLILAVYSGPLGWGIELSVLTRLGLGANALWNGVDVAKMALRRDCRNSLRRYENRQSLNLLLNVAADILISIGPTSVPLQIIAGLLTGFSVYQSGDIIQSLVIEGYQEYKRTDCIPLANALNVANALLLFANASVQFSTAVGFLGAFVYSKVSPLLPSLPTSCEMSELAIPFIFGTWKFANSDAGKIVVEFLKNVWLFVRGEKSWAEFKKAAKIFFFDFGNEVVEYVDLILKDYISMKTKINARAIFRGNIIKTCYRAGLTLYDYLKFLSNKKKLDGVENIKEALGNVFSDNEKAKGILKLVDEKIHNLIERYLDKIEFELDECNLLDMEKLVKAEVIVKSQITREILKRLNISAERMNDIIKLDPECLKKILDEIIEDMSNKINDPESVEEFRNELSRDEKLILMQKDEKTEAYIFKEEKKIIDFDSCLQELKYDTSFYELKKEGTSYTFTFNGTSDQVMFITDENPEDGSCYIIVVK